jgi:acetyltransferase-like isoleucine patch superfamily enzyme
MTLQYLWAKLFKKIQGKAVINSRVHRTSKVEAGSEFVNSTMDKHSFCGYRCEIINCDIGSFCSIANNVIIGGGMHPMDWVSMSPVFYEGRDSVKAKFSEHRREPVKRTIIGHDVWIGENVLIKQGVTIGTGSVIGMGSVVTKDVEPFCIYAGVPAKFIKKRFSDDIIIHLLKSEWWTFPEEFLYELAPFFNNPYIFIQELNKIKDLKLPRTR